MRGLGSLLLIPLCAGLAGCGGTGPTPTPAPSVFVPPTVVPTGPDVETVTVGAAGVGAYQLVTVPVAFITNNSNAHSAIGIVVHFTPTRGGRALQALDSPSISIPPATTVAVTADCTDACNGADATGATVSVSSWGSGRASTTFVSSGVSLDCSHCGGPGFADVNGTLGAAGLVAGAPVVAFAVCHSGASIVGGGQVQLVWAAQNQPQQVSVSAIISTRPSDCQLYAALAA